jgi:ATP-dependent protease HslVU (ClpYQ) ATPase subunit
MLKAENVELSFTDDAIREIASVAFEVCDSTITWNLINSIELFRRINQLKILGQDDYIR